jgi:RimJ/RimL family protein N-acetyltransferase
MVKLSCTKETFIPSDLNQVQWLQKESGYEIAQWYWQQLLSPLSYNTWLSAYEYNFQYAVIMKAGKPVSCAGVWRFSESAWEVIAVSTLPPHQHQGYAKKVVSFITDYILGMSRLATCTTDEANTAMIATATSVGFRPVPSGAVWWNYPEIPDF